MTTVVKRRTRQLGRISRVATLLLGAAATAAGAADGLTWRGIRHDFGNVRPERTLTHTFRFDNTATRPVRIDRVQTSCGCTVARPDSRVIAAGATGALTVTFDPHRFRGAVTKYVRVQTAGGEQLLKFTAVVGAAAAGGPREAVAHGTALAPRPYRPGIVLIRFRKARYRLSAFPTEHVLATLAAEYKGRKARVVQADANLLALTLRAGESVPSAVRRLGALPAVAYAQPDYLYAPREVLPDDTRFDKQWSLHNTGQADNCNAVGTADADIDAPEAWEIFTGATSGNGSIIAVLDNGVDYTHPELSAVMWDGTDCVDEHGVALGNCIHGYDFTGSGDRDPMPTGNHGTHVAGIIAAQADNGRGIAGIVRGARIMAVRSASYSSAEFVKGIYFARYNGATVINASWGWSGSTCDSVADEGKVGIDDPSLYDAIAAFPGVFVMAAGNAGRDHNGSTYFDTADYGHTTPCWQGLPNMISVTSSDNRDHLLHDYGVNVDLAAPGKCIYSTVLNPSYNDKTGTSMAAPHVVGVAALLWGYRQELTPTEVRETILRQGDCIAHGGHPLYTTGNGYCEEGFAKRLNAYRVLAAMAEPVVGHLRAYTTSTQQNEIPAGGITDASQPYWTWQAPEGQGAIETYQVTIDSGTAFAGIVTTTAFDSVTENVTLAPGAHIFQVIAVNDAGGSGPPAGFALTVSDDAVPARLITIAHTPATVAEGDTYNATVSLAPPALAQVTVDYVLTEDAARAGAVPGGSGTLTWQPGEGGERTLAATAPDNALDEFDRTLTLTLSAPVNAQIQGAATAQTTLTDNDPAPGITVSSPVSVTEGATLPFVVALTEVSGKPVTFAYTTEPLTATAGADFATTAGEGLLPPGQEAVTIDVPLAPDTVLEKDETLALTISDAINVEPGRSSFTGTGTITDNDVDMTLVGGWNFISAPVLADDPAVPGLLAPFQQGTAWRWNAERQGYEVAAAVVPAGGYAVYAAAPGAVRLEGLPERPAAVRLTPGWNLIGVWQELAATDVAPYVVGPVWGLVNGRLTPVTRLVRAQAYWVYANETTDLPLTSP